VRYTNIYHKKSEAFLLRSSYGICQDYQDGHDDSQGDNGYLEDFLKKLPTLNGSQTLLLENTGTIFLVMVMVMVVMLLF
jgi:hypothetical protein